MIKLGSSDMAKAYVGSTEVSKVYLGSELVYTKEVLPYDAEIEYIGTTGANGTVNTQYIDTGITASNNTQFDFDFASDSTNARFIFGSGSTGTSNGLRIFCKYESGASDNGIRYDFCNKNYYIPNKGTKLLDTNKRVNFNNIGEPRTFNYENLSVTANSSTFSNSFTLTFFASKHSDTNISMSNGMNKLYYCKLWSNGNLVRDMIPVRVGQVGYMYDKVSKQLFGNSGTGSFTLGNDI